MSAFWTNIFGKELPTVEYCEKATNSIIARPGYFISNFAYIFLGIYLFTKKGVLAKTFGIMSIIVGVLSAIYDASFLFYSQILDLSAMSLLIILLLSLNLEKLKTLNRTRIIILAAVAQIIYMVSIMFFKGQSGRILFGTLVLAVIITEYIYKSRHPIIQSRNFYIALALFLIGFIIWMFDATQTVCSPIELINGRGIYHVMTAISIYYLYKHYTVQKHSFR